jgi:hypothetical protein
MAEQHELFQQVLRRNVVSRRSIIRGSVGAAGAAFLLGGASGKAFAATLDAPGTIAGGFVVNGRHLSFGRNPERQMWVAGQLFNLNTYNAVPSGITSPTTTTTRPTRTTTTRPPPPRRRTSRRSRRWSRRSPGSATR